MTLLDRPQWEENSSMMGGLLAKHIKETTGIVESKWISVFQYFYFCVYSIGTDHFIYLYSKVLYSTIVVD